MTAPHAYDLGTPAADPQTVAAYARYYTSGHYDRRYPRPNPTTLRRIKRALTKDSHILDFGCGSGRYLLPLSQWSGGAVGFDISAAALDHLAARLAKTPRPNIRLVGPDTSDVMQYLKTSGPVDVILYLFGVLAHVKDAGARQAILNTFANALTPKTGRLFLSVPNAHRRFWSEQKRFGSSIQYARSLGTETVTLPYQLYTPKRLDHALRQAGFRIHSIQAESVFSESIVARIRLLRWLDTVLTPVCPRALGYGLLAEVFI
jgi:SAM-dependent methyltransferase